VAATPEVVKAAFTKEGDVFAEHGIRYEDPVFALGEPDLFERQLFEFAHDLLGVTRDEHRFAFRQAFAAHDAYLENLRERSTEVLRRLEHENRVGVVVLGRPYHNDPGLNHEIVDALQMCGYPVFTIDSLPSDEETLSRLFGDEIARGEIRSPMDIDDVWKNGYSENSSRKLWAAKYAARHPNLVALDLSSFKCGHDAPMYHAVEAIVESSGTPYFTFHDIDENKPSGSIKIRVETIAYFLERYQVSLQERAAAEQRIQEAVRLYEAKLRRGEGATRPEVVATPSRGFTPAPLQVAMSPIGGPAGSCGTSCTSSASSACGAGCSSGSCGPAAPTLISDDELLPLVSIETAPRN
jgi:predicted nucleotide-binding protein (sugar kinase/HSP70/actin superfamily)